MLSDLITENTIKQKIPYYLYVYFFGILALGATSIDKIGEVRLTDEIGGRGLKL